MPPASWIEHRQLETVMATVLLDPEIQEKFLNTLQIPNVIDATQGIGSTCKSARHSNGLGLLMPRATSC
jgi:hypothetical protein